MPRIDAMLAQRAAAPPPGPLPVGRSRRGDGPRQGRRLRSGHRHHRGRSVPRRSPDRRARTGRAP